MVPRSVLTGNVRGGLILPGVRERPQAVTGDLSTLEALAVLVALQGFYSEDPDDKTSGVLSCHHGQTAAGTEQHFTS